MYFSTFTQSISSDYVENITKEQEKRVSAYTLPIIPAICKSNFLSVKAVTLTSLYIKRRQKLLSNWRRRLLPSRRLLSSFVKLEKEYSAY